MYEAKSDVLLTECREFMTHRMRTSMSRMMGNVEDTLFELATTDCGTVQASQYIDAVREIRMKKREIQVRFENRFLSLFDESVRQIRKGKVAPAESNIVSNIVNLNQTGSHTIVSTVEKVRSDCRAALSTLDQHIGELLQTGESAHFDNPMEPGLVFDAFWESCRDIQTDTAIRRVLVQMFERHVATDLQQLYEDLNKLFASFTAVDLNSSAMSDSQHRAEAGNPGQAEGGGTGRNSVLIKNWVQTMVLRRMHDSEVEIPGFIQHFLLAQWCQLLEQIYEKHGDRSQEWLRAMQLIDDLIMSAEAVTDRDHKRQQLWKQPGLIYRLKNGMKSASIPLKTQAEFLSQLKAWYSSLSEFSPISAIHT
jgi:hypothetical protein